MHDSPLPTYESFGSLLNTTFHINATEPISVKLVEVSEKKETPRLERFAILFLGPLTPSLDQGLYDFEHDQIGQFTLFIVPVAQDQTGRYYEAVFNLMRNWSTGK